MDNPTEELARAWDIRRGVPFQPPPGWSLAGSLNEEQGQRVCFQQEPVAQ